MVDRKVIQLFNRDKSYELAFVFCLPGKYRVSNLPSLASKNSVIEFSKGYWVQEITVSLGLYEFVFGKSYVEQELYYRNDLTGVNKKIFPWFGIDFREVKEFLSALNKIVLANNYTFIFDIPSVSEWEHALLTCKDETWSWGHDDNKIQDYAWYRNNSENKVHTSGQKKCNDWGLYDMYGNVYEYCYDSIFNNEVNYYLDPIIQTPSFAAVGVAVNFKHCKPISTPQLCVLANCRSVNHFKLCVNRYWLHLFSLYLMNKSSLRSASVWYGHASEEI